VEISPEKNERCFREKSISLVVFQVPSIGCKVTNIYNHCLQILHHQIAELRAKGKDFNFKSPWQTNTRRWSVSNQPKHKENRACGICPYSFYVHSVDPNDSHATLRLWFGKKAVLGVSSDDMIDNMTITIKELEEGVFSKRCDPRYEIANNQHWNSRLFLGFVEHQFHKVII